MQSPVLLAAVVLAAGTLPWAGCRAEDHFGTPKSYAYVEGSDQIVCDKVCLGGWHLAGSLVLPT